VSFDLDPGHCLLVVGPSGSGKSTLALALAGLVPSELPGEWRGRLTVGGFEVASDPSARGGIGGRVGLLFQDPDRQLVMERVEDDVAFGLENRGWPWGEMLARVPDALAEVGLQGFERRRSIRLSGGEQQRLALAGVLAPRPGLLILDEPTANLDPEGAALLFDEIAALKAGGRATLVLIEHQADLAWPLADRVLALASDGSPLAFGPPAGVLSQHGEALRSAGLWLPDDRAARIPRAGGPSDTGQPVVEAVAVSFAFDHGQPVISRASITIRRGDRAAIVGRNGSGKSTLGRLLVGLLRPTTGTVRLGGDDPARLPADDLARRAGYAFQDPERQFLASTVRDEVTIGLRPTESDAVDELMAQLGLPLDRFADRSPYRLSGGEQRRLSLACMLARRPDLLVLDEPTFGQDRHGHDALLAILRDRVDAGSAVLAMTHDRRFVAAFADRVLEMRDGRPEPLAS